MREREPRSSSNPDGKCVQSIARAFAGYFYTTDKNKRTTPDKLEFKKYDPKIRQHVMFKEAKIK